MISLLLVISTYYRGKKVVLEIPMVEKPAKSFSNKNKKKLSMEREQIDNKNFHFSNGLFSLYNSNHNNLFAEIFSLKNLANNSPYIFDITIDEYRYISCPIFLDLNKYMSSKKTYNEETEDETEDQHNDTTNLLNMEENNGVVRLKMFNIVLVFEKNHKFLFKYLDNIYKVLECFSHYNAFEQYRTNYLSHEIFQIFKIYEKCEKNFKDKNREIEDSNFDQESVEMLNKKIFEKSILAKNLTKFFEEFNHSYFKFYINNFSDFKGSIKLNTEPVEVKPFHTLLITKRKNIDEYIIMNHDVSPIIKCFLDVVTPFKNFEEISLENDLPYDQIIMISKQIHSWKMGRIIKKINNNSIFSINPDMPPKAEIEKLFEKKNFTNSGNLYEILNCFLTYQKIDTIFTEQFTNISNKNFLMILEFLLLHEYLIPCSHYLIPKLPFKRKYDHERILLMKANKILKKSEKTEACMNDMNVAVEETNYIMQELESNLENLYFEDMIKLIKKKSSLDAEILYNIFYLLNENFDIEEISYLTGYKINKLNEFVNNYKFLFNIIIYPKQS